MKALYWVALLGLALCVSAVVAFSTATVTDSVGLPVDDEQRVGNQEANERDFLPHPPIRQSFRNDNFQLVIAAVDDWETPGAIASLYKDSVLQWEQLLSHEYGPRFAVVGPQGQVLLLDEYINVASSRAITLLSPDGDKIAQYSFADISQKLAVPAATLTHHATSGWWISALPSVLPGGTTPQVSIPTGGTTLSVDLSTGEIDRHDL